MIYQPHEIEPHGDFERGMENLGLALLCASFFVETREYAHLLWFLEATKDGYDFIRN